MAQVNFSLDTETGVASVTIDGKVLTNGIRDFRFYKYSGSGFEFNVSEESTENNGITTVVDHRAYGSKIITERKTDSIKTLEKSLANAFSRKN